MKLAIVNDSFLHIGGAEKVFLDIVDIYPNADLYIPIINSELKSKITKRSTGQIYTTLFSKISFFSKHASILKPLLIFYWKSLNLSGYDLILSSSHSFNSKLINTPKNIPHISYVYTPPRYLYNYYNEVQLLNNPLLKIIIKPIIGWLKNEDKQSGKKPTIMIGISKTVQNRIKNIYKRRSLLIYPPVKISSKPTKRLSRKYFLCFSRLVKQKGINLAVETCTKLNLPLVVVGTGPELNNLKQIAGPTIVFKGYVSDKELEKIFIHTKALINCSIEEDFGMVTIEAATRGIPTIGYKSGGLIETIKKNKTGIFFEHYTVESLSMAIKKFEKRNFSITDCYNFSKKFSKGIFKKKIKKVVKFYIDKKT